MTPTPTAPADVRIAGIAPGCTAESWRDQRDQFAAMSPYQAGQFAREQNARNRAERARKDREHADKIAQIERDTVEARRHARTGAARPSAPARPAAAPVSAPAAAARVIPFDTAGVYRQRNGDVAPEQHAGESLAVYAFRVRNGQ